MKAQKQFGILRGKQIELHYYMLRVPGQTLRYGNTDINNSNKCFPNNTSPRLGDFIIPSLLRVTRPQEIAFNSAKSCKACSENSCVMFKLASRFMYVFCFRSWTKSLGVTIKWKLSSIWVCSSFGRWNAVACQIRKLEQCLDGEVSRFFELLQSKIQISFLSIISPITKVNRLLKSVYIISYS